MTETFDNLIKDAKEVSRNAYAPYSKLNAGAALLCRDGSVYTGVNVENVSFPAGTCAERSALSAAVSDGKRKFTAIAIYSEKQITPCGFCRQTLIEFGDMWVITASADGEIKQYTLSKLLPEAFLKF